jgi:signal transduction histidine kinase
MNVRPFRFNRSPQSVRALKESPTASLLVKLEWMLLTFSGVTMLLMASIILKLGVVKPDFIGLSLLSVSVLVLIGLRTPSTTTSKVCFTALELSVLALPSFFEDGLPFFPILGLVTAMRSCQRFGLSGRLIVSGLTFAEYALMQLFSRGSIPEILIASEANRSTLHPFNISSLMLKLNGAFSFGLALFFVMLLINALLEERQSQARLMVALEQLRQYSLRIEDQSALQERNRIAREIHDSLGHTLTAQSIQLDSASLLQSSNREEANVFLREAKLLCKQALREVRHSVTTLRSDPFQGRSLDQVATTLIQEFRATTAIETTCMMSISHPVPSNVIAASYRVMQEALTNIVRHSAAADAMIQLFTQDGILTLQIQDNGKGFEPTQNSTGYGIQGMKERIAALDGQFKLSSQPGEGCLISVKVPLVLRLLT